MEVLHFLNTHRRAQIVFGASIAVFLALSTILELLFNEKGQTISFDLFKLWLMGG